MKQATALDILKTGHNVFLTGSAGSGKTHTLNQYIHYLRGRRVPVAVTASTGIAATHMNGTTIHSWSGIGIKDSISDKELVKLSKRQTIKERIEDTAVLIIDEISMLHAKQLNLVNQVLKYIRQSQQPFGGIQLVVAGDFFQLPPVGDSDESNRDKFAFMSEAWLEADFHICYLSEQHRQQTTDNSQHNNQPNNQQNNNQNSVNALSLNAPSSNALSLDGILNQIRRGEVTYAACDALLATAAQDLHLQRTRLYTHNVNVNRINEQELAKLNVSPHRYTADTFGDSKVLANLTKAVRVPEELTLKVGAKVMFVKNINELSVFNGSMGEVVAFAGTSNDEGRGGYDSDGKDHHDHHDRHNGSTDEGDAETSSHDHGDKDSDNSHRIQYPVVRLNSGRQVIAAPEEWMVEDENGEVLASYVQVPLCLAWAITIHKSQGMTLDAAEIDLSRTFELGQGYVALSRLKSLTGLKLLGMNELSLQLDPLARGADRRFLQLSTEAEHAFRLLDAETLSKEHDAFVLKSGGTLSGEVIAAYDKQRQQREQQQHQQAQRKAKQQQQHTQYAQLGRQLAGSSDAQHSTTVLVTRALLEESLSIAEIAQQRELAQSTIMRHIAELRRADANLLCEHLRPDETLLQQVQIAHDAVLAANDPNDVNDDGSIKLRPIYQQLDEKVSYNDIRLALIFL